MTVTAMQAYRFALDPTPAQARDLERHAGAARFAYNWALAAVKANIGQRAAERSYGLDGDALTPALGWNLPALRRAWNATKHEVAPWWTECSKEAFNTGLDGMARALRNFACSKSGKRAGRKAGFPRFKARRRATPSVRFTTGTIRVETDRHHITLPRLGRVKTHESTRKLARRIEAGTARVLSATIRREAGRWLCSFTCEVQRARRAPLRPDADAGFAEIRRQLTYKTGWYGGRLVVADRWFPSSKTCSACQTVRPKLSLATRTFTCEYCGLGLDRDLNAALNLKHQVAQSGWETRNGRGADQKTKPGLAGGSEASTPHRLAG